MRLLLLSNSRNPGSGYLEHARAEIADFLGPGPRRLAFIPYAAVTISLDDYLARVKEVFGALGHAVESVHEDDPVEVIREADGIIVGGGNSFRLLERLQREELVGRIRKRVRDGAVYIGWSAGANLACPTIRTTNDMPIVEPHSFEALGLVPFQINPHYTDGVVPNHGGETRAERLAEFLAVNPTVRVAGLPEGTWLRREGPRLGLGGPQGIKLFEGGRPVREVRAGESLDFLLG